MKEEKALEYAMYGKIMLISLHFTVEARFREFRRICRFQVEKAFQLKRALEGWIGFFGSWTIFLTLLRALIFPKTKLQVKLLTALEVYLQARISVNFEVSWRRFEGGGGGLKEINRFLGRFKSRRWCCTFEPPERIHTRWKIPLERARTQ